MTAATPADRSGLDALPLQRKVLLLSGRDFWSTEPIEEVGLPSVVLTDGPHGVRRAEGECCSGRCRCGGSWLASEPLSPAAELERPMADARAARIS